LTRRALPALAAGLLVATSTAAWGNARAETEEARVADILQSALVAHGREVNRCFERALADTLDVAGKIELAVDVGAGGKVTKAVPERDDVGSPVLLACLRDSAVTWTLAGIDPGSTVIVPLAFEGQANQFSIKVKDAPEHNPPAQPGKKPRPGAPPPVPPFSVRLLVDEATMHARQAALTELTVAPANRIAMHKHPGAEVLYVRRGHARILGPTGVAPEKLDEGMAIYIPGGMPHAIENMGRQTPAVLLDLFVPMGPERVYRDPKDEVGRAAFQVIRDAAPTAPPGAKLVVASPADADTLSVFGGKGKIKPLLEPSKTGTHAFYLGLLEAEPGAEVPRNSHPGSAEILFVISGGGELTVGSEKTPFEAEEAIHIPENQPHAAKLTGTETDKKTVMVQIFAPAGPEERYRAGASASPGAKPKP
jgi:quercetin dioxygenase-like cupin family protein